jgi:hypothetical protein
MMGWLDRLKYCTTVETHASKPRQPPELAGVAGFLGSLAYPPAPFEKSEGAEAAANDPSEVEQELIEERAAIMEFDGGMHRTQAERLAKLHTDYLLHHWQCPTCFGAGQGRGQRCTVGSGLWAAYDGEAEYSQSAS